MKLQLQVILATLVMSTAAHAQAPGETEAVSPPGMTPAAPPAPPPPPVAPVRRWSLGLGFGSLSVAPHMAPDASTDFSIGSLSARYRPWTHLEIELAFAGGGETAGQNGYTQDRVVSEAVLALRYRFNPERRWNFWVMAGMGSFSITQKDATKDQRDAATQSTLQFGAGLERRWERFALQFEMRAVGVAPNDQQNMAVAPTAPGTQPPPPGTSTTADGWKGGQFALSGNYYF